MASYAEQVGERLRNIRLHKGLSPHDVEERSGKEFKASVLPHKASKQFVESNYWKRGVACLFQSENRLQAKVFL